MRVGLGVLMFKQKTPKIIPHVPATNLIFPNEIKETLLSQHSAIDTQKANSHLFEPTHFYANTSTHVYI